jgi:16S rRNA (cytosine967-C5)-methyltransferase
MSHPSDNEVSLALFGAAVLATTEALTFVEPADVALSTFFRRHKSGARDRAFIAEAVYAVIRRKRSLEALVQATGAPSTPRSVLLVALTRVLGFGMRQLDTAIRPAERQWLLDIAKSPVNLSPNEQLDLPDWLSERLAEQMGESEVQALATGLNLGAPLDLRVNILKTNRQAVLNQFAAEQIPASACPYSPLGIRLGGKPALQKHPLFLDGSVEVQDEGSQLLCHLVQPRRGEMVVDFCAGAGGKTLGLGALMRSSGRLYAFDTSEHRLAKLKPRAARAGLSNVHPACISSESDLRVKRLSGKVDRVLVDAPCSGLGTLRRNPDLKWRQSPKGVAELTVKQRDILAAAAHLLKVGGRLVYATCSVLDEENSAIVDAFLRTYPNFVRLSSRKILKAQGIEMDCGDDLRLLPHRHQTDGFYAAVLQRQS